MSDTSKLGTCTLIVFQPASLRAKAKSGRAEDRNGKETSREEQCLVNWPLLPGGRRGLKAQPLENVAEMEPKKVLTVVRVLC